MTISERISQIRAKIEGALSRSPHGSRNVTIMAASKDQSVNDIKSAAELGIVDFGENYAQDLMTKAPLCQDVDLRWHYIGKIQTNKIKHFLPYVSSVCSVDSLEIAQRITRVRESLSVKRPPVPILIQVNVGSERQKAGLPPTVIEQLFDQFMEVNGIIIAGLMSIPPHHKDPEKTRPYFKQMKEIFDLLKSKHPEPNVFNTLSMGMSEDYEVAVEEGSTNVRIGRAIFGERT